MSMADEDIRDEVPPNAACICKRRDQGPATDPEGLQCKMPQVTLLSTVVAPAFVAGELTLVPVPPEALPEALALVGRNLCGHPVTDGVLRDAYPNLPAPERAFWDGTTLGLAVRPKSGVRGAQASGDTEVGLSDLEAVFVCWTPMKKEEPCQRD
jgi:hypothetical protein